MRRRSRHQRCLVLASACLWLTACAPTPTGGDASSDSRPSQKESETSNGVENLAAAPGSVEITDSESFRWRLAITKVQFGVESVYKDAIAPPGQHIRRYGIAITNLQHDRPAYAPADDAILPTIPNDEHCEQVLGWPLEEEPTLCRLRFLSAYGDGEYSDLVQERGPRVPPGKSVILHIEPLVNWPKDPAEAQQHLISDPSGEPVTFFWRGITFRAPIEAYSNG